MAKKVPYASNYHKPMAVGGKSQRHGTGNKNAASPYHKLAKSPRGRNATT